MENYRHRQTSLGDLTQDIYLIYLAKIMIYFLCLKAITLNLFMIFKRE